VSKAKEEGDNNRAAVRTERHDRKNEGTVKTSVLLGCVKLQGGFEDEREIWAGGS
jgi:hypothetical protein